jgi:hypothetical protein
MVFLMIMIPVVTGGRQSVGRRGFIQGGLTEAKLHSAISTPDILRIFYLFKSF